MAVLLFGGVMNTLILQLQLYIWCILAMFLMLVGSYFGWYFLFWEKLRPLWGLFHAHMRKESAAFTFDKNLNFVLKSEKKAKLIFDETVGEAKKAQKVWDHSPSGMIGRVQTDLIFDEGEWTDVSSPNRQEIDKAVVMWNETNPEDEIHTLIMFGHLLQTGKIQCPIDKDIVIPWLRIRAAMTPKSIGNFAGYIRQLSETIGVESVQNLNNYGILILVACGLISVSMFAFKALKLG